MWSFKSGSYSDDEKGRGGLAAYHRIGYRLPAELCEVYYARTARGLWAGAAGRAEARRVEDSVLPPRPPEEGV